MFFKNFKNKLLIFLIALSIFSIPISAYAYSGKVILGGENIGINVNSKGVLVVGFYDVNGSSPGRMANLQVGDIITKVDDTDISVISDLSKVTNKNTSELQLTYLRNNQTYKTILNLVRDGNNTYKTGLYVKDRITGIGTLTFIVPDNNKFAALGHEISEKSTGKRFEIKDGNIFKSNITGIIKSSINNPGEKKATYDVDNIYGSIDKNEVTGIYGIYNGSITDKVLIEVADTYEVQEGKAYLHTVISGDKVEKFEINILKINKNDDSKNILFEITDKKLLKMTGGVVQGMSGSPITQNDKLIGAVNYVVVDSPKNGYGILIDNMLKNLED